MNANHGGLTPQVQKSANAFTDLSTRGTMMPLIDPLPMSVFNVLVGQVVNNGCDYRVEDFEDYITTNYV